MIRWSAGLLLLGGLLAAGCRRADTPAVPAPTASAAEFNATWYQGKAELTHYAVEQARYGELRKADAVLIFVTEDFLPDRQVKLEDYTKEAKSRSVPILKLNAVLKFQTGIYPYSVMTSVFSPVDLVRWPHALKVSNSVQEWCGHVYTQLNNRDGRYHAEVHSYFEKEGDQSFDLEGAFLEDELWTRIRLNPAALPTGSVRVIPGMVSSRFLHRPLAVETAEARVTADAASGDSLLIYHLEYRTYDRQLAITFRRAFPHEIMSFESTVWEGFGAKARKLTSRAVRTRSVVLDYWVRNTEADSTYRTELDLP